MKAFSFWGMVGILIAVSLMHFSTPDGYCMPTTLGSVTHAVRKCSPDVLERLQTPQESPDPDVNPKPWENAHLAPGEAWGA